MYRYSVYVYCCRPNTSNANKKLAEVFDDLAQEQGIGTTQKYFVSFTLSHILHIQHMAHYSYYLTMFNNLICTHA